MDAAEAWGLITVHFDPPAYDGRLIRRLRPPEVEGEDGEWLSRWLLHVGVVPDEIELSTLADELSRAEAAAEVMLSVLGSNDIRLELRSQEHPLDPDAYPLIDRVLIGINRALRIVEINGSPRDWWRTFRPGTSGADR